MAVQKLMRQKINVSPIMLFHWKKAMDINLGCLITKHLLTQKDYGNTFDHQDRTFKIIGMTESDNVILEESVNEEKFYWECTADFVQLKLGRFYTEYKMINGIRVPFNALYENRKLHLPVNRMYRKKKEDEETVVEEQEPIMETYVEDTLEESL
jgi:hypothetical protein